MVLQSDELKIEVRPDVGGKIGQIVERTSNRAFLVPPRRPYQTIPPGGRWIDHDVSGMDDCFPNIAAGLYPDAPWSGTPLPDLGEWVLGGWEVADSSTTHVVLEREAPGILPYGVRKVIRVAPPRSVNFQYEVESRGAAPLRYLWAAHPLIKAGEQFAVRLPAGPKHFRTFPWDGRMHSWPMLGTTDLSSGWIARETNLKVFVGDLREGWCELRLPGWTLRFTFDLAVTPVVGIWYNNFGFPPGESPFRCIAVEPSTSASDLLDDLPREAYPAIASGCSAEWHLRLEIAAGPGAP